MGAMRREVRSWRLLWRRRPPGWGLLSVVVVLCAATVVLVGRDGTPAWQLFRVVGVVAATAVAVHGMSRTTSRRRAALAYLVGLAGTAAGGSDIHRLTC